ncbi:MAG: desulfoferrodoxin [Candidatus Adiutrix sp.]
MAERNMVFNCSICGNIMESLFDGGGGPLTCCGKVLTPLRPNTVDAAQEKHVPVVEKIAGGYKVTVGSTLHPMEEKHYIAWIELSADGMRMIKFLKPGEAPVAEFKTDASNVVATEYCNLHGLWQTGDK